MSDLHALMDRVAAGYRPALSGWASLESRVARRQRVRRVGVIVSTLLVSSAIVTTLVFAFRGTDGDSTHAASGALALPHNLILNARNFFDDGTEDGTRGKIQCLPDSARSSVQQIGVVGKATSGLSPFAGSGQEVPNMFAHVEQTGPGPAVFASKSEGAPDWSSPSKLFFTALWVQSDSGCLVFYRTTSGI